MMSFQNGGMMRMGQIAAPFVYVPNLSPVGSGAAYFPGDVENDANALEFLGFLSERANEERTPSMGSQRSDMANQAGAWDPMFRSAIGRFQGKQGITADTWVGPQTRTRLGAAVLAQNLTPPGKLPPPPPPPGLPGVLPTPVDPGRVPALPTPIPGVTPAASTKKDPTLMYVGIGAGVLVVGGLAYYALK